MYNNYYGFYRETLQWRTHAPIVWYRPLKSYLNARKELKGCKGISVKIVRSDTTKKTGKFVFQIEGFESAKDFLKY